MNFLSRFIKKILRREPVGVRTESGYRYDEVPLSIFETLAEEKIHTITVRRAEYKVKGGSLRYIIFKNSMRCACCQTIANVAYLEKQDENYATFHVNLYYRDYAGNLNLFTKDHIRPKAKHGTDDLSNLQTMCAKCNHAKGDTFTTGKKNKATAFYKKQVEKRRLKREEKAKALAESQEGIQ